jgi:hypothetical protein
MGQKNKAIFSYSILAALVLFHLISTAAWLTIDRSYLKLDAWGHYRYSLAAYEALKNILNFKLFANTAEPLNWYGILVGFVTAPFYFIFGTSQDTAIMITSAIFLPILVFSTYVIGKRLLNDQAGLLSAFIVTFYPVIFNHLRLYMLDLPLAGMVSLSLSLLLVSDNFNNRKNSLLFALSLALGSLVKLNYLAFMAGPLVLTLYRAYKQKTFYLIMATAFLCALFYLARSKNMLQHIYAVSYVRLLENGTFTPSGLFVWKWSQLLAYIQESIGQGISFLFLAAFILGLVAFIRLGLKDRWLLYLVALIPLLMEILFFSLYPGAMVRYNLPFLPVIAVISSVGLLSMKPKIFRTACLFLLIPLAIMQFFAVSYGIGFLPQDLKIPIVARKPYPLHLTIFEQNVDIDPFLGDKRSHPSRADWKSTEVLKTIMNAGASEKRIQVLTLSNIPELVEAMEYQILKEGLPVYLTPVFSVSVEDYLQKSYAPLSLACQTAGYVITCDNEGSEWEKALYPNKAAKEKIGTARQFFRENIGHFKMIKQFRLPDGGNLCIYKNIYKELAGPREAKNGVLKLLFDNGRIRIFHKDIEITKGLGLYTSLFALDHWRDSTEATWEIKKINESKLTATGVWLYIPVTQRWEIELKDGNVIDWRVTSFANDAVKIEKEDYKLMLSDKYREWFTSGDQSGKFADYFEKGSWKTFWEGNIRQEAGVRPAETAGGLLPEVRFNASVMPLEYMTSVENSDRLFNARVVGCSKKNGGNNGLFSPGRDKYFNAKISID